MPSILPNTPTADAYPSSTSSGGCQVGLNDVFESGYFVVANSAAFAQYQHGIQGQQDFSSDIFLPPATYPLVGSDSDPLGGIRFKSAVAGTPAQVFGVLYKKNESALLAGSEFGATVSTSGGITPPSGGGVELAYSQIIAQVPITDTTQPGDLIISTAAIVLSGSQVIMIEFFAPRVDSPGVVANRQTTLELYEDAILIADIWAANVPGGVDSIRIPVFLSLRRTPAAGSHTYTVRGRVTAGNAAVFCGNGGADFAPAFLRVVEV
jgi:hypothetical protein